MSNDGDVIGLVLFRVGLSHPWPAWHGDTLRLLNTGDAEPVDCCVDPTCGGDGHHCTCADGHEHHLRLRGGWPGAVPTDGLIPLDERAEQVLASLAVRQPGREE